MPLITTRPLVEIYTDGSCWPNPGPGGWAAMLLHQEYRKTISGGCTHTTNNRMEMMAAIQALSTLKLPCAVNLYSDSRYLVDGLHSWRVKRINHVGIRHRPDILNQDLWIELIAASERHQIQWQWVRGHGKNQGNNEVDKIAGEERKRFTQLLPGDGKVSVGYSHA